MGLQKADCKQALKNGLLTLLPHFLQIMDFFLGFHTS